MSRHVSKPHSGSIYIETAARKTPSNKSQSRRSANMFKDPLMKCTNGKTCSCKFPLLPSFSCKTVLRFRDSSSSSEEQSYKNYWLSCIIGCEYHLTKSLVRFLTSNNNLIEKFINKFRVSWIENINNARGNWIEYQLNISYVLVFQRSLKKAQVKPFCAISQNIFHHFDIEFNKKP